MSPLYRVFCLGVVFYSHCLLFVQGGNDRIFVTDVLDGKIYVGENTGPDFHGENITEIFLTGVLSPVGIDFDYRTGKFYWTDEDARTINRASLDGSNQETLLRQSQGIGYPQGLVVDTVLNKIYWSDTLLETIMSASTDGSNRRTLIDSDLYLPWGITLSQKRSTLYWSDEGVSTGKIEMCNKDGTNRRNLITARIRQPYGLALDSQEQRLYWTDGYYDLIESINLDDWSERNDHVYAASGNVVIFGVSLYFSSIYFTDFASSGLHEADVGVVDVRTLTNFTGSPTHVRVYADLTCSTSCAGNSRCELIAYDTPGCTCIYGWEGFNCLTRVMCYLPTAPSMTSFVDPQSSYSPSTTVTVACDNGNGNVVWTCNGYTGNWEQEPIDCSQGGGGGDLTCSPSCAGNSRCELLANDTHACTCIYGWEGLNCLTRVMCYLPTAPSMTSFVDPQSSYSPRTIVTVACDNGNGNAVWTCNGYTGNWEREPIDCAQGEEGTSVGLIAGIAVGVVVILVLLMCCFLVYRAQRKPPRAPAPTVQNAASPVVFVVGNQARQPAMPNTNVSFDQTLQCGPGPSGAPVGSAFPPRAANNAPAYPTNADASGGGAYPHNVILEEKTVDPDLGQASAMPPPYTG